MKRPRGPDLTFAFEATLLVVAVIALILIGAWLAYYLFAPVIRPLLP